jgi:hypothetical protein
MCHFVGLGLLSSAARAWPPDASRCGASLRASAARQGARELHGAALVVGVVARLGG